MKMTLSNRSASFNSCLSTRRARCTAFLGTHQFRQYLRSSAQARNFDFSAVLSATTGAGYLFHQFLLMRAEVRKFPLSQTMTSSGSLPSRRNLPRASHACQRCRAKKAKCDQQQPCANCVRHEWDCVYGLRRKNGRASTVSVLNDVQRNTPPSPLSSSRTYYDEAARRSEPLEQAHSTGRIGIVIILALDAWD
jgi:hypothetical protein